VSLDPVDLPDIYIYIYIFTLAPFTILTYLSCDLALGELTFCSASKLHLNVYFAFIPAKEF
jgi:hypothetical protein